MDRRLYLTAAAGVLLSACTWLEPPSREPTTEPRQEPEPTPSREAEATVTARTRDELLAEIDDAESGETVFVPPSESIDLSGVWGIQVPPGVTVSGGGTAATEGAVLASPPGDEAPRNVEIQEKFSLGPGARLTGVRLEGHHHEYVNPAEAHDGDFYAHRGGGVRTSEQTVVDNCEIAGWPYAGVVATHDAHVHHNFIHHNTWEGLGYGIAIPQGDHMPIIEFNDFNYNRHAISAGGGQSVGYVARYNVVGPDWVGSQFDMHGSNGMTGTAGERIEIHNNTFQGTHAVEAKTRNPGGVYPAIQVRGVPTEGVWVTQNWFYHDSREGAYDQSGGPQKAHFENNHYGSNEPRKFGIGAPRSYTA